MLTNNKPDQPRAKPLLIFEMLAAVLMGLVFLSCGILGLFAFSQNQLREQEIESALRTSGVKILGVVTDLQTESGYVDEYGAGPTIFQVYYRYQAGLPGGGTQEFKGTSEIGREYHSLRISQTIPIVYAASEPSLSRLQAEYPKAWATYVFEAVYTILLVAFLLFVIVCGLGILSYSRNLWRQRDSGT